MTSDIAIADILKRIVALEKKILNAAPDRRLNKRQVAVREGNSTRSIDRHVADGSFPAPEMIHGRAYWWLSTLEAHDAERLRAAKQMTAKTKRAASRPTAAA
jgi:predicted DNA-binding transcriptional regulator AlpA